MEHRSILGMRVDATSYNEATRTILDWARRRESKYVCIATVNNVMEAVDDEKFCGVMNASDLVTSDGMPLVWGLRRLGVKGASRVYGPDLFPRILQAAEEGGIPVGFYGGANEAVLDRLEKEATRQFPDLRIAYRWSPPFRPLTPAEDEDVTSQIAESGAGIVFVGLSTPKQELWMAAHRGRMPVVMLGIGAAFDFFTGTKAQAPRWMMRAGLEWLFRLVTEPRRLWRRYLKHNPRFVVYFAWQLLRGGQHS